jgi:hypothetical protein
VLCSMAAVDHILCIPMFFIHLFSHQSKMTGDET